MLAHLRECGLRVRQRRQVVEIGHLVRRPSEMLRNKRRLVALDESAEAGKMCSVERLGTTDRHAYPMQRNRMVAADALERLMRRSAGAHVVLGVHLEEAGLRAFCQDGVQVLVLEAGPGRVCDGQGREAETTIRAYVPYARDGFHGRLRSRPAAGFKSGSASRACHPEPRCS